MKQKLFESVGSNQFKLITENVNGMPRELLVKEGVRKVFMNAGKTVSYKHIQGVGLGYIKDVSEAKKTAIQEARILAKEYGYADNESNQTFVKEDGEMSDYDRGEYENGRPPVSTPGHSAKENREVQIAKEIIREAGRIFGHIGVADSFVDQRVEMITRLAQELIDMHSSTQT